LLWKIKNPARPHSQSIPNPKANPNPRPPRSLLGARPNLAPPLKIPLLPRAAWGPPFNPPSAPAPARPRPPPAQMLHLPPPGSRRNRAGLTPLKSHCHHRARLPPHRTRHPSPCPCHRPLRSPQAQSPLYPRKRSRAPCRSAHQLRLLASRHPRLRFHLRFRRIPRAPRSPWRAEAEWRRRLIVSVSRLEIALTH
jgi:hypothetical protein